MIYSPIWGSRYSTICFKYLSQMLKSAALLIRKRPSAVIVMSPPVVACLVVWIYCIFAKARYAIDAHTAAFVDPPWKSIPFIHAFFSRRAATTIVTNEYLKDIVCSWNARASIVGDVPVYFSEPEALILRGEYKMTFVCSFTKDEPIQIFLQAARKLEGIQFYITGNTDDADPAIIMNKPDNVEFTGYLPESQYAGLLINSDAIICLTTADHTMQRGAYEAVYLGKPVVTSDFKVLRDSFYKGAVYVGNTEKGIVEGITKMKSSLEKYRNEALELRDEKLAKWKTVEQELRQMLLGSA
jgi:glycosyltransferase involved in cell wall biosynthesis